MPLSFPRLATRLGFVATCSALLISCGGASASGGTSTTPASGSSTDAPASTPPRASSTPHPSLTPVQIRAAIGAEASTIQVCYNGALARNPGHRGSVLVFFEIAPDGHVLRSSVVENTSGDDEVGRCLLGVVQRLVFPPTGHGIVETRYSFDFREIDRDGDGID